MRNKHNKEYIQPLIRTQKKVVRLIKNLSPQTHTKPIMKQLKILNITSLYIFVQQWKYTHTFAQKKI